MGFLYEIRKKKTGKLIENKNELMWEEQAESER